jgi:hypothetical protein
MREKTVVVALAVMLVAMISWSAPVNEGNTETEVSETLEKLETLLPDQPALANGEIISLLQRVAETHRLDAAYLLIRGLAFNLNPDASLESLSLAGMIPAVNLLRYEYGEQILPVLFFEGITVKEAWLRKRIAFTIREIADPSRVAEMSEIFNLGKSQAEGAKDFAALLVAKKVDVELYDPDEELKKKLTEWLKRLDQQHR